MTLPKLILLDRDGVLNFASSNPVSPLYYVTQIEHIVLKPGAREAIKLIQAHGIPTVLVTRQRCISKGLASREQVNLINVRLERMLEADFDKIYIEESAEDKTAILKRVFADHPTIKPSQMAFFDDSITDLNIAINLGIPSYGGSDLLGAVKMLLNIS